jgi:hypothetical protein
MTTIQRFAGALTALSIIGIGLVGCGSDDNRTPTQAEVKAADVNRQKFIENLNVPEDQKAQMRAHMGGPPASNPADAARANAANANGAANASEGGRRN